MMAPNGKPIWNPEALRRAMERRGLDTPVKLARALSRAGMPCVHQNIDAWLRGHAPAGITLVYLGDVLRIDPKRLYVRPSAQEPSGGRPPPGG